MLEKRLCVLDFFLGKEYSLNIDCTLALQWNILNGIFLAVISPFDPKAGHIVQNSVFCEWPADFDAIVYIRKVFEQVVTQGGEHIEFYVTDSSSAVRASSATSNPSRAFVRAKAHFLKPLAVVSSSASLRIWAVITVTLIKLMLLSLSLPK